MLDCYSRNILVVKAIPFLRTLLGNLFDSLFRCLVSFLHDRRNRIHHDGTDLDSFPNHVSGGANGSHNTEGTDSDTDNEDDDVAHCITFFLSFGRSALCSLPYKQKILQIFKLSRVRMFHLCFILFHASKMRKSGKFRPITRYTLSSSFFGMFESMFRISLNIVNT